jgi:regulatory protein
MRQKRTSRPAPADELGRAKDYALRLLEYRARSEAEIARRLARRGHDDATIERAVADLRAVGLLNDHEFARAWVASRRAGRPTGRTRLRWELRRHGVDADTAAQAVEQGLDPEAEFEAAWAWARQRVGRPPESGELRRLHAALQRRGFGRDIIREIIERLTRNSDPSP